jgi:hypothetical protein
MCTSESHTKGQIQRAGQGYLTPKAPPTIFIYMVEEKEDNRKRDKKRREIDPKIEEREVASSA